MMDKTETDPPIEYEWCIQGPKGALFVLYPVKGTHTDEDVTRARIFLRNTRDIAGLQVRWVNAGDNKPPPEKIPLELINKDLLRQIGEKESYILELEDKLRRRDIDETRQLKKEIQSEPLYKKLKAENKKLDKENLNLRATISDLVTKLNQK